MGFGFFVLITLASYTANLATILVSTYILRIYVYFVHMQALVRIYLYIYSAYLRIICTYTGIGTNSRDTYTYIFVLITLASYTANLATILVRMYVYSVPIYVHNVYCVRIQVDFFVLITLASYTANLATILISTYILRIYVYFVHMQALVRIYVYCVRIQCVSACIWYVYRHWHH